MQTINLYRYTRENGGITVSTIQPDVEYTTLYRLVADEGMTLTNGTITTSCVDTDDISVWTEIVDTQNDNMKNEEVVDENEATIEDYQNALREVGVNI
jgi:hypothetical protein